MTIEIEGEKMMASVDVADMRPQAICAACARKAVTHRPSGFLAAYCRHREIGAVKYPGKPWELTSAGYPFKTFEGDVKAHLMCIDIHINQVAERDEHGEH